MYHIYYVYKKFYASKLKMEVKIRESLRREKFYRPIIFSPNLLAGLYNALILVSWRKKSRRQCNTKTRSASIAI